LAALLACTAAPASATPPHCPPGHAEKGWCAPSGAWRLPPGARDWNGWHAHGMRPPARGERWVVVDRDAYAILDATREAIGAVERATR
jgi:Ni/Co efflux regulator RcnB